FSQAFRLRDLGLLINTTNCRIPDFSPWEPEVIPFLKEANLIENCSQKYQNWSHMDEDNLILDHKEMLKTNFTFEKNLSCCYKAIERTAPGTQYNDWSASVSNCTPIKSSKTKISAEFIVVECSIKNKGSNEPPKYRMWHGIATTSNIERKHLIKRKLEFWKKHKTETNYRPPNILIIGHDSTSRLNFRRQMPKTLTVLENLGAVEMLGYMRVGESTFPNFVASLTGYNITEYTELCMKNDMLDQDDCPFIWRRFDAANYLTALIEDEPNCAIFHYKKAGFSRQQVDFYSRPMFLDATRQHQKDKNPKSQILFTAPCISYQTNDEAMLTYLESIIDFGEKNSVPLFPIAFATYNTHGDLNGLKLADGTYASFLQKMKTKGTLDNTILFVLGDHGVRFGSMKNTLTGSYEENLPNLWIFLPHRIKKRFPEWENALKINSRRLTSPFHMYWTLNYILDKFTQTPPPQNEALTISITNNSSKQHKNISKIFRRKYQHRHLFEPVIRDASCSDVGVPDELCTCHFKNSLDLGDPLLEKASNAALNETNAKFQSTNCSKLKLGNIIGGAIIDRPKKKIVVGFTTNPGNFSVEAVLNYEEKKLGLSHMQRTDKINQSHVWCVNNAKLELFCYCKT
ncbi:hypothetical protein Fcan01_03216, partial [Folsomia candida]